MTPYLLALWLWAAWLLARRIAGEYVRECARLDEETWEACLRPGGTQ